MSTPGVSTSSPINLRTLLCHRDVELGIYCLSSVLQFSVDPVQIVIHDDGSLTLADRLRLTEALPGSRILDRKVADEIMVVRLAQYPNAAAFRQESVWGLKLLDVVLAEPGLCFYLDSDIRFFRPFQGLFIDAATRERCVFLRDTVWQAYSIRPWHLLDRRRLRVASGINSGMTFCDPQMFDLSFVDWFLSQLDWRVIPAWTEPTCWASLALRACGHAVDPSQIVNLYPSAKVTQNAIGGHFLSSYRAHWESLLHQPLQQPNTCPVDVSFHRLSSLSPIELGFNQAKRKLQNSKMFG